MKSKGAWICVDKGNKRLAFLYYLAISLFAVGFALYLRNRDVLTDIETLAAKNWLVAWLFMLSLYVFRAFVPFLPSFAFYAMSGRIFPGKVIPLLVSFSGVMLLYTLSYLIGRMKRRGGQTNFYLERYQKLREALFSRMEKVVETKRFGTLLLLSLSPFPQKTFGRICGRLHLNFSTFLMASLLGTLPKLISVTMLGKGILDLSSPLFYISLISTLIVAIISLVVIR